MRRRTLTMAAAAAALLVSGGQLPAAGAGGAARAAVGRWTAHEAESFWTAERMASAVPLPASAPAPPGTAPHPVTAAPSLAPAPAPAPASSASRPAPSPSGPVRLRPVTAQRPTPARPGVGQNFDGVPVVGRMFVMKGGGAYFCTASVVSSPGRDLVLSAAHCLLGTDSRQVAFVPKYTRADPQPYGKFPVLRDARGRSKVWIDPRYRSQGPDRAAALDVAFAQVGPDAQGRPVEKVVGGNRLVTGSGYAHGRVSLIGYPASAARPRLCVNRTTKFTSADARIPGSFLRIRCTGYPGGTSGGPFLTRYDRRKGTGDVVGVIGGWKTGGDTPDVSYSSYFGSAVRKLYEKAVAAAKAG
ncbi:trypsin-like peptidase domain-containing protein [Streptomyces sp. NPDC002990]